jgi:hypothetical protein
MGQPSSPFAGGVPTDIANQLMYWTVRSEESTASIRSLGCASLGWSSALLGYYASGKGVEGSSFLLHQKARDWIRHYLDGIKFQWMGEIPRHPNQLRTILLSLEKFSWGPQNRPLVLVESPLSAYTGDWQQAFRDYQGDSLAISIEPSSWSVGTLIEVERALPPDVPLRIRAFNGTIDEQKAVETIKHLCEAGRMLSLCFGFGAGVFIAPLALNTIVDAMCGPALIVSLGFSLSEDPGQALQILAEKCVDFLHLKLLCIECQKTPCYQDVEALANALKKRQETGRSRITIALTFHGQNTPEFQSKSLFSEEGLRQAADVGLFFCPLFVEPGMRHHDKFIHDIRASIGDGPFDIWNPAREASEDSSDSDVIVEVSDEEYSSDSSDDDAAQPQVARNTRNEGARTRNLRRQYGASEEIKVKKRDKCVIS